MCYLGAIYSLAILIMKLSFSPNYLYAILPVAAGIVSSCADYDPITEETRQLVESKIAYKNVLNEYTQNFEARYGKIDPNHDWGMMMPGIKEVATRATVDNRNEWVTKYHLNVPGWPDTYYKKDGVQYTNGYHYLNSGGSNATYDQNPPSGSHPAGDVTDEEIQYVSWWFRTHQYPESLNLHWTDFFVQGISADNDRDATGNKISVLERYEKNNDDIWERKGGDEGVTYTIDYFSAYQLQPEDWNDGWDHIKNYNHGNSNVLSDIDNLKCDRSDTTNIWSLDGNYKSTYSADISNRLVAFYESSGTENFRAAYSQNNAYLDWNFDYKNGYMQPHTGHSSWVLVHLEFVGPSGRIYKGNYLGFDYQCYKEEEGTQQNNDLSKYTYHAADGYYSNWIFKLSPATPTEHVSYTGLSRRIMCEDLGNTFDFDFNDVVFDATYNITQSEYEAYLNGTKTDSPIDVTITLQAAGGTLPIYVGFTSINDNFEAHRLLGENPSTKPVNVNAPNGASSPIAIYHYKLDFPQHLSTDEERLNALNLNNIPILVASNDNRGEYLTGHDQPWANEYTSTSHPTPTNKGSKLAPRAFGVPVGVCWMNECQFIETSYTHFDEWVQDQTTYGDNAIEPNYPWYVSPIENKSNIHKYSPYVKPADNPSTPDIKDYSAEYGTKIPVHELVGQYSTDHYLQFSDFPQRPGKYTITFICAGNPNNENPSVNSDVCLKRSKYMETYWDDDNDSEKRGTITQDANYASNKSYIIQFHDVDINDSYYNRTSLHIMNMYGKGDMIGDVYVTRTGESDHESGNMFIYPTYGNLIETAETINDSNGNPHCYLPVSVVAEAGEYQISVICQTQNDPAQWSPNVNLNLTDKTAEGNSISIERSFAVVDVGMNIAVCQISLVSPFTNESNYSYIELVNIFNGLNDGLNSIKEIRIKKITQE